MTVFVDSSGMQSAGITCYGERSAGRPVVNAAEGLVPLRWPLASPTPCAARPATLRYTPWPYAQAGRRSTLHAWRGVSRHRQSTNRAWPT